MSTLGRYRLLRALAWLGIPAVLYIIGKLQAAGMSGQTDALRRWFFVLIAFLMVELPVLVAYYYYKSADKHMDQDKIAVETLAALGKQRRF